jgi:hypothetical protein
MLRSFPDARCLLAKLIFAGVIAPREQPILQAGSSGVARITPARSLVRQGGLRDGF